jgi:hypothetical protein
MEWKTGIRKVSGVDVDQEVSLCLFMGATCDLHFRVRLLWQFAQVGSTERGPLRAVSRWLCRLGGGPKAVAELGVARFSQP